MLIAHAQGEEAIAERLAEPIRAAGYDVVHRGTVLVGESVLEEASRALADGSPVVLCGTVRAMGTGWAHQVVTAARAHNGTLVFGVQVEKDAYLRWLTFDAEVAAYWADPERAIQDLLTALRRHHPLDPVRGSAAVASAERRFREVMLGVCDIIDLANLPIDRHVATRHLLLRSLFVPLQVTLEGEAGRDLLQQDFASMEARRRSAGGHGGRVSSNDDPVPPMARPPKTSESGQPKAEVDAARYDLGDRLRHARRLVVLGDPGAGKTTLLRWVATAYLLRLRNDPDRAALPGVGTLPDEAFLPVLIRCRDLGADQLSGSLEDIVGQVLRRAELRADDVDALRSAIDRRLSEGTVLLLIDGLDEIADPSVRARFCRQLEQIHVARPKVPIIATSRIVGYQEMGYRLGRGFEHLTVADLDQSARDEFVRRWCAVTEPPDRAAAVAGQLMSDMRSSDRIGRLTGNPLMLTTMALVKRNVGKLPDRRADLYREAVKVLLNWRSEVDEPIDHREAVPQLEYLAYAMADAGVQQLTDDEIETLLERMRIDHPTLHPIRRRPVGEFLRVLERRTGLLKEAGYVRRPGRLAPVYEFRHLTFQEYLAALSLVEGRFPNRDRTRRVAANVGPLARRVGSQGADGTPDSWREPLRLCATICQDDDVDEVLMAILTPLADEDPGATLRLRALLAAECLEDEPHASPAVIAAIIDAFVEQLLDRDEPAETTAIAMMLVASRWAEVVTERILAELRRRWTGSLLPLSWLVGELSLRAAPADAAGQRRWIADRTAALAGGGDQALAGAVALGHAADVRQAFPWSGQAQAAAGALLPLLSSDDPVLAAASAWALHRLSRLPSTSGWQPTYAQRAAVSDRFGHVGSTLLNLVPLVLEGHSPEQPEAVRRLRAAAVDPDPALREWAAEVLGRVRPDGRLEALVGLATDPVTEVRRAAVVALGGVPGPIAAAALLSRTTDPDPQVRVAAAVALGEGRDASAADLLLRMTADEDVEVRATALQALLLLADRRGVDLELARLASLDVDSAIEGGAVPGLGRSGDTRLVLPLLARLAEDRDPPDWAVEALGDLQDSRAVAPLLALLTTSKTQLRAEIIGALGRLKDRRAATPIVAALHDPDAAVRIQAAYALANLGSESAREPLMAAVGDPDPEVRTAAVLALGQLGGCPATFFAAALADGDGAVRRAALVTLGDGDDARASDLLIGATRDADPAVRKEALRGLGTLSDPRGLPVVGAALDDATPLVRAAALDALPGFLERAFLPEVRRRLSDPDIAVRSAAAYALGRLDDVRSLPALRRAAVAGPTVDEREAATWGLCYLEDARVAPAVVDALRHPDPGIRGMAAPLAAEHDVELVLEPMLRGLDDPDPEVSRALIRALGAAGDPRAVPGLLRQLDSPLGTTRAAAIDALGTIAAVGGATAAIAEYLTDPYVDVRVAATWALGAIGHRAGVPALLPALSDPSARVRAHAVWALGVLDDDSSAVLPLLDADEPEVRARAVQAVGRMLGADALPWLLRASGDPDRNCVVHAVRAFARCPASEVTGHVVAVLGRPHDWHRSAAARTLGMLGDPDVAERLVPLVDDPALSVRWQVARALGRLENPVALPALRGMATDADPWLRSIALWALDRLGEPVDMTFARRIPKATIGSVRRHAVVMVDGLGDPHARRLLRKGLTVRSVPIQRRWVEAFAELLPDPVDNSLLSAYGDGLDPWVPARAVVDPERVSLMARMTGREPAEVRARYERLARRVPLQVQPQVTRDGSRG